MSSNSRDGSITVMLRPLERAGSLAMDALQWLRAVPPAGPTANRAAVGTCAPRLLAGASPTSTIRLVRPDFADGLPQVRWFRVEVTAGPSCPGLIRDVADQHVRHLHRP